MHYWSYLGSPGGACNYCEFINFTRHDGPSYTFYMGGTNNLIDGAHIWNMGHDVPGCVPPDQEGGVHCGFGGYAIHIRNTGYPINNWVIRNSLIHDNRQAGIFISGGNHLIYNNIIYNSQTGYLTGTGGSKVFNNTFVNNKNNGIVVNVAAPIEARNNILWNSGGVSSEDQSLVIQSNNLTTDPRFVNEGAFDFHLQSSSPAIDAGISLPDVPCDFDGNQRPAGGAYDIGAYEYGASPGGACAGGGPSPLRGDLNGDGKRDLADVRLLIYMLIGQQAKTPEADLTGDGAVTLADVQALIRLLVGLP